ncbi:MAG: cytochrome b/b6 domain-containing protein [Candidatus Dormiibacterota bacterium]
MTSTPTSSSAKGAGAAGAGTGPETVERFSLSERLFHWAFAIPFMLTILTGLALYFQGLEKLVGSRELVRDVHRFAGLAVVVLPLVVLALGDRRGIARDASEVDRWSEDDRRWFRSWLWRKVGGRDKLPAQGRFNAGQKFNAVLTLAGIVWLSITGLLIFPGIHPPFWLVSNSRDLHNLAWMVLTLAVIGHIFLAAVYPPTRPGLFGIITGRVRRDWLAKHHPLSIKADPPKPKP